MLSTYMMLFKHSHYYRDAYSVKYFCVSAAAADVHAI